MAQFALTVQENAVNAIYESRSELYQAHGIEAIIKNLEQAVQSPDKRKQKSGTTCSELIERANQITFTLRPSHYNSPDLVNATFLSTSLNETANTGIDCTDEQLSEMMGKLKEASDELHNVISTQALYVDKMEKTYTMSFNTEDKNTGGIDTI